MVTAETIDHIIRFQGDGLPVVSLYSPVDPGARRRDRRARVLSLLHRIRPLAKDSELGGEARMSLRTDIESGWLARSGDVCPLYGKATRRTPDVIDELVQAVIDEDGSVKHVEAGTKLADRAVAAYLRFPPPPPPPA
jgi:hypothetical protein